MKFLIQISVVIIPLIGLFRFQSVALRVVCALIITIEAFCCGWVLSSIVSAFQAWNRYGEPSPPYLLGGVFAAVAAAITLVIAIKTFRPMPANAITDKSNSRIEETETFDLCDDIEGPIDPQDPDAEIKRRANNGTL